MKQLKLFKEKQNVEFGGSLNRGKRKTARPLSCKSAHHHVLKANDSYKLLTNKKEIIRIIRRLSEKFGVKLYDLAVHADHIHLPTAGWHRTTYKKWIRAVTGVLAKKFKIKWRLRPYSRIVSWGRQFQILIKYVKQNRAEGDFMLNAHVRVKEWRDKFITSFKTGLRLEIYQHVSEFDIFLF